MTKDCLGLKKFPQSQSVEATDLIHGVPTSKLPGLKGPAANVLAPDSSAHIQTYCGVHASKHQDRFGSKGDLHHIRAGDFNIVADQSI